MMNWNLPIVEFGVFASVTALMLALADLFARRRARMGRRIAELSATRPRAINTAENGPHNFGRVVSALQETATQLLPKDPTELSRFEQRLEQAGLYQPSALYTFVLIRLACMFLPWVAAVLLATAGKLQLTQAMMLGAYGAGFGMLAPMWWLDRRKARRHAILSRSLPDFLDLLVACLGSGLSLDAGLRRVTSELQYAHPILAREMERVQQETDLGTSAHQALYNMGDRTDLETCRTMGTFVKQAQRLGTGISEALRMNAELLRTQREQRAEELAQKASVKILFPTLLLIFPTVFVVVAGPAMIQLQAIFAH